MDSSIVNTKNNAEKMYRRGSKAAYSGDYLNGIYYLKQAVMRCGDNPLYISDLAFALNGIGHYADAFNYAVSAMVLEPDCHIKGILYFIMGESCLGDGRLHYAEELFRRCLNESPDGEYSDDAQHYLTELAEVLDSDEDVEDKYQQEQLLKLAQFRSGDPGNEHIALELMREYTQKYGETVNSLETMINVLYIMQVHEMIIEYAHRLLKLDPGSVVGTVYGYYASIHLHKEDDVKYFRDLLEKIHECYPNELGLLLRFFNVTELDEIAQKVFYSLYKKDDYNIDIIYALGVACYNTGNFKGAAEMFDRLYLLDGGQDEAVGFKEIMAYQTDRPEKLPYLYCITPDMEKRLSDKLDNAILNGEVPENENICSLLTFALDYAEWERLHKFLDIISLDNKEVMRTISKHLIKETVDLARPLRIMKLLKQTEVDISKFWVNYLGIILNGEQFEKQYGDMVLFEVSINISFNYEEKVIRENIVPLRNIATKEKITDSAELNFILNILICKQLNQNYDIGELAKIYNITEERAEELNSASDRREDNEQIDRL